MKRRLPSNKAGMFILIVLPAIALFGFIVMLLWNEILAKVVNVSTVTFWQALGILLLSRILFGGFRGGGWHNRRRQWRQDMTAKWATMTPEEREKFKQEWQQRCGRWRKPFNETSVSSQPSASSE